MKLHFTKPFIRDYRSLSLSLQKRVDKQLSFLLQDSKHPSLRAKKTDFQRGIWRARVTDAVRFTFQIEGDTYILRHKTLRRWCTQSWPVCLQHRQADMTKHCVPHSEVKERARRRKRR